MHVMDLTQTIGETMPVYPGTEQPKLTQTNTIEKDGFKETLLRMYSHTGTHMDAPAHIFPGAPTLDALPAENSRERHAWWTAPMRERTDGLRCGAFKTCARRQMKRNSCYFIRAGAAFGTMDATLARTLRLMRM